MSRRAFIAWALAIVAVAAVARTLFLRADPPVTGVGIVWHDEGAWTHSARNQALWGAWRTDNWNPVYVAPVFTALEYASFRGLGVGTWQARVVPILSGLAAVIFLMIGVRAIGDRTAALVGGSLLATDYVFVMWNRAALMESTMTAFMVVAWGCYAMAARRPIWGAAAGLAAVLAFFSKAAAAFFIGAIVIDALLTLARTRLGAGSASQTTPASRLESRAAVMTLAGVVIGALAVLVLFVLPNWSEYQFYNWQMSVVRKPSYGIRDLVDRASWLPIVQSFFTRMWPVLLAAVVSTIVIRVNWRTVPPAARLLVWWLLLGFLELIVHDAGNERRYVMFIPAIIALAALYTTRWPETPMRNVEGATWPTSVDWPFVRSIVVFGALLLFLAYLTIGAALQPIFDDEIAAGNFRAIVRISALAALAATILVLWPHWPRGRLLPRLIGRHWSRPAILTVVALMLAWNTYQYVSWARHRTELHYQASRAIGDLLPPGTLVHGKLANGLALENRIRPIFVGRGFGNYDDRLSRDDVRYILTYVLPTLGYESQAGLIQEILDRYPRQRVRATFDVDETTAADRAALIDKFSGARD